MSARELRNLRFDLEDQDKEITLEDLAALMAQAKGAKK